MHKHAYVIHGGRYLEQSSGRWYDIWVCTCGSDKKVYA